MYGDFDCDFDFDSQDRAALSTCIRNLKYLIQLGRFGHFSVRVVAFREIPSPYESVLFCERHSRGTALVSGVPIYKY